MNAPALRPLFIGDWQRVLFIHYRADSTVLQRQVPFELDLWHGSALVSVVAFSMRRFRPFRGHRLLERIFSPVANHEFLNVRTYVGAGEKRGIYFITEWVNNRLSQLTGPRLYGLPYRYGEIALDHKHEFGRIQGQAAGAFEYAGIIGCGTKFETCEPGGVDEFLLERYSAFTERSGVKRFFDIWHEPWPQCAVDVTVRGELLRQTGAWFDDAEQCGANYSPGVNDIWMGGPRKLKMNSSQCFASAGAF